MYKYLSSNKGISADMYKVTKRLLRVDFEILIKNASLEVIIIIKIKPLILDKASRFRSAGGPN